VSNQTDSEKWHKFLDSPYCSIVEIPNKDIETAALLQQPHLKESSLSTSERLTALTLLLDTKYSPGSKQSNQRRIISFHGRDRLYPLVTETADTHS
jgi:hypothetical protein